MRTRTLVTAVAALAMFSACRDKNQPDAYGNFETTEVVVSAETSGQLLWFKADEGQPLAHGQLVGVIDTTQLALQQRQLSAQRSAGASRVSEVGQQLDALRVQHEIAGRNYERVKRLFAEPLRCLPIDSFRTFSSHARDLHHLAHRHSEKRRSKG